MGVVKAQMADCRRQTAGDRSGSPTVRARKQKAWLRQILISCSLETLVRENLTPH
jgi:hypothetical protein